MAAGEYKDIWGEFESSLLIPVTKEYRVCVDNAGFVDWETTREYDDGLANRPRYSAKKDNAILQEVASLEAVPSFRPRSNMCDAQFG